jgi:23S rRNA pseudouridine2605 synthase
LEHIGLQVNRLIRLSFGPFQLGNLEDGEVEEVNTRVLRDQLGPSLASAAHASFGRPSLPEMQMEMNTNSGPGDRKRKHVRALRDERHAKAEKAPRRRIVRSTTEDRKGREVAVERVVPTRPSRAPAKATRNARRFGAERPGGGGAGTGKHPSGKAPRPKR